MSLIKSLVADQTEEDEDKNNLGQGRRTLRLARADFGRREIF